jgi:hypothetical protein
MLGVAGVLGQEILRPDVFWYEAGEPQNLPGPFQNVNMGGLLAWEFLLMHWVEVRRWQDYKNFGSVNEVRGTRQQQVACYYLVWALAGSYTSTASTGQQNAGVLS